MAKEIQLTRGKVAIVDDDDYEWLNKWKWCAIKRCNTWYAERRELKSISGKIIRMHRLITCASTGEVVDHKNRDGLDNRRNNLRKCTPSQNNSNSVAKRNSTSGFKGIYWDKHNKKWRATISIQGYPKHLGRFKNKVDAARAYNEAAIKHYGEFARINILTDSD